MKRLLIIAALCTATVTSLAAARAEVTASVNPATLAAARELMKASDIQGQMKAMAPSLANAMDQQIRSMFTDAKMPEGLQSQMAEALKRYLTSMDSVFTPELMDEMATVYARHFTVEDLTRITAMMNDPAMVRFRSAMPTLMADLMPTIMKAMQPRQRQFQAEIMTIVRNWIQSHPEDKAKLRSPISS